MATEPKRRLYRSTTDKKIAGVCGGIAEFFALDPTVVRVATVLLGVLSGGAVVIAYIIAMVIVPEDTRANG